MSLSLPQVDLQRVGRIHHPHHSQSWCEKNLKIKDKDGNVSGLKYNSVQQDLNRRFHEMMRDEKPVRMIILKARQIGCCLDPNTRVLTADLRWILIKNLQPGQEIVAVDEMPGIGGKGHARKMRRGVVEAVREVREVAYALTMEDGRTLIATGDHRFLVKSVAGMVWRPVNRSGRNGDHISVGDKIRNITAGQWSDEQSYEDGWFAGMLDGEGCLSNRKRTGASVTMSQVYGAVYDRAKRYLERRGYSFREEIDHRDPETSSKYGSGPVGKLVVSRTDELFRLLGTTRPSRFRDDWWEDRDLPGKGRGTKGVAHSRVVKIQCLGERPMIDLQTSIKTFVAEGFVSHNSTWTESVIYDWINHVDNQDALILADSPKSSTRLYEMFTTFYDHHVGRKPTRHMHAKGIKFQMPSNSQVVVDTAKRKYAGTSLTVQCAHLSEVAKWDDPETTFLSLAQALPGRKGTFGVMESTAAGAGDWFNEQWDAAERGESAWMPCFYSWFEMPEYQLDPRQLNMSGFGEDPRYNLFTGEEKELVKQFKCSDSQMAWRRWAISNNCGGDVLLFHQEYPSTPEEAFISAGNPRFSVTILSNWRHEAKDPMTTGMFPLAMNQSEVSTTLIPGDVVNIWDMPIPGHNYVIGADSAGSDPQGDYSAAVVLDKSIVPVRCVATIHGWMDADVYASQLASIGRLYNNALLAIEVNGIGDAVQNQARHLYHNFYHRLPIDREVRMPGERIGWATSHITRPMLIEALAAAIRDQDLDIPSADLILELLSFHTVPGHRMAEAKPGTHDDYVFALGIAVMAINYTTAGEYKHYDADNHVVDSGQMARRGR